MASTPPPPNISDLADQVSALLGRRDLWLNQAQEWQTGTATGGPNGDGLYPIALSNGDPVLIACPAKLADDGETALVTQVQGIIAQLNEAVADVESKFGDVQAASASAYAAQASELEAKAEALAARISVGMTFPRDFTEESTYWTQGNGQIAQPEVGANNPLTGSFAVIAGEGQVYRTEANPESCQSFGPLGFVPGIAGTRVKITTRVRCIVDNTAATTSDVKTGVGFVPLNADFSLEQYIAGQAIANLKVADGYKTIRDSFVVPLDNPAPYYRPTVFYNVAGTTTDPIHPANDVQGNGQYEFSYVQIDVYKPGQGGSSNVNFLYGAGTVSPPAGAVAARITLVGGQGGMHGHGPGGQSGGSGNTTTFGGFSATGGGPAECGDLFVFYDDDPPASYDYQQGYGGYGGGGGTYQTVTKNADGSISLGTQAGAAGEGGRYGSIHVEWIY